MNSFRISLACSALAVLASCATPTSANNQAGQAAPPSPLAQVETPQRGLPAQTLNVGECGLFLWTRREQPEFIFFSKAGSDDALLWIDGEVADLNRVALGGDIFGQQLTEQDFAFGGGRMVELRMEPGEQLVGGQRVPEASLTVIDAEGWRTMIPVAGVTACQPEQ